MVEDALRRYETTDVGGAVHLYYPAERPAYPDAFRRFAASAPSAPAAEILEFDDVILGDGRNWACLYDSDGRRIDASALTRYDEALAPQLWRADPIGKIPKVARTIAEPVVYGSVFFNHWGHFLLESAARLWVRFFEKEFASLPVAYAWPQASPLPPIAAFLAGAEMRTLPADVGRIRLAKCFVPNASLAHEGYADARHLGVMHEVARRLLRSAARDDRPAYLSRSQVASPLAGRRGINNEAELEARLRERGVRIVHMQALTLAEQIAVMNAHRRIIGLWGSAMHNTMFALEGAALSTFTLLDGRMPANFWLVDSLVDADAHYLSTVRDLGDGGLSIDVDATLAYLEACGALRGHG